MIVGDLLVNCYIVSAAGGKSAIVVDPGGDVPTILKTVQGQGLTVTAVVNTHGHGDHIGGNSALCEATGAPLIIGEKDADMLTSASLNLSQEYGMPVVSKPADKIVREGDSIYIDHHELKVLETPGHSAGSITLVGEGFALVGDLLFAGSVGRTDFPGGNFDVLIKSIHDKLYPLGDDCVILPGHENLTTIGKEKQTNPFLRFGNRRGW